MQVAGAMRGCAGPARCPSPDSLRGVEPLHLLARSTPKHALVKGHTLCRGVSPRLFAGGQLPVDDLDLRLERFLSWGAKPVRSASPLTAS